MAATKRTFSFAPVFASSIPDEVLKAQTPARDTANDLPFKAFFTANAATIKEKNTVATLFVPFSYFTLSESLGGRGVEAKVDAAYVRGKLRDQFNAWQAATKVIVTKGVYEQVERTNTKTGKKYMANGKAITPEVSHNVERGGFSLILMDRTGKEKDIPNQKELGITEPGVQLWVRYVKEDETKQEAAKAAAEANKADAPTA